mgnify:CR=1 FL=1
MAGPIRPTDPQLYLGRPGSSFARAPRELRGAIDTILERSALAGARVGILVSDVESGKVLYARDADALLNPASNVKLFTSAAALAPALVLVILAMGSAYQFNTTRTESFVEKAESLAKGAVGEKGELSEADSGRLSIYATSLTMLKKHPVTGVGIGHYKWNYLDAQRDLFRANPKSGLKWQYIAVRDPPDAGLHPHHRQHRRRAADRQ